MIKLKSSPIQVVKLKIKQYNIMEKREVMVLLVPGKVVKVYMEFLVLCSFGLPFSFLLKFVMKLIVDITQKMVEACLLH